MSRFGLCLAIASAPAGCGSDDDDDVETIDSGLPPGTPTCTPPPQLTYDCQPVPLGTPNSCGGGPTAFGGDPPDTDKAFPLDCKAEFPFCLGAYPNAVATCWCNNTLGPVEWYCPV